MHVGAPDNVESYIQETGRAGRDGQAVLAMLLMTKSKRHLKEESILDYFDNETNCRRDKLFENMEYMNMWIWIVNVCVVTSVQKSVTVVGEGGEWEGGWGWELSIAPVIMHNLIIRLLSAVAVMLPRSLMTE